MRNRIGMLDGKMMDNKNVLIDVFEYIFNDNGGNINDVDKNNMNYDIFLVIKYVDFYIVVFIYNKVLLTTLIFYFC